MKENQISESLEQIKNQFMWNHSNEELNWSGLKVKIETLQNIAINENISIELINDH